jgi:hypothetical protein
VTLRKLVGVVPVIAALALAAPVATAGAQTTAGPGSIPCYPYPAFCGPDGQPWFHASPLFQFSPLTGPSLLHFGPGPVQLP